MGTFKGLLSMSFTMVSQNYINLIHFTILDLHMDQDALDSAAGGNFLDKMPREGLAIIESKSKVRYSRSRPNDSRAITNAPSSTSSPSNNSFEIQQMAALLEDKMNIRMSRLEKKCGEVIWLVKRNATTPATVKAVRGTPNSSYPSKLQYPDEDEKMLVFEHAKFNDWLSALLGKQKEKLERIAIMTVNAECSAIIMNKVPEKLEDPGKFLIPCALQELNRTSALADSGASINLLPHSIYKQHGLEALTPTRMTLELANRSVTHPMGIAEDVVVRVDGFTFLADFVVVNFEPDPRVPIILGRPFLRTAKALIDLYEENLTLRVGKEELFFSGEKTSDNFEKFADELAPLDSLPSGNDDSILKKDLHEENFQVYSNPLFEFDDNFKSSTINPLFDEMEEDVEIKNSNVSDEPVLLKTPLSDKVECFTPEDDIDEIDAFLAIEVSSNFEEGYFDSEGDVTFLDNLLSDDVSHNLVSEVEQNESSITFSPRSDPLHHEFAGELLTLPSRDDREFREYLSLMTVLCEISTSRSQENVHANQSSVIESLPVSPIPVEDSEPA
ncbi:reverse transcriptase domain-containing protein [Tanacetum coccineum]